MAARPNDPPAVPAIPDVAGRDLAIGLTAALLVVALLSSYPAVTRLGVTRSLTAGDLIALRCGVSGVLLLPYVVLNARRIPRRLWRDGIALAFFQGWGTAFCAIGGLQFAPAGHLATLGPGCISVWVAVTGWLVYRKRLKPGQFVGLSLIVAGGAVLLISSVETYGAGAVRGDLLFVCASILGALYLIYIDRHRVSPLMGASLVAVYSAIVVLPYYLLVPQERMLNTAPLTEIAVQFFYQGVLAGGLMTILIGYAVMKIGSQRFSMTVALVPVAGLILGRVIAGDAIAPLEWAAVALVSSGVWWGAVKVSRA